MPTGEDHSGWSLVVPFKGGLQAKSRLAPGCLTRTPDHRRHVALGFLADTLATASSSPLVSVIIVVSSDPAVLSGGKVHVVPDPGQGLNAAIKRGVDVSRIRGWLGPIAALTSDLPALRKEDLETGLSLAAGHSRGFVPDWAGTGTTLLSALDGARLRPRFGESSCLHHTEAGYVRLGVPVDSTLRADVDTPQDLARALALGVGPSTAAALGRCDPVPEKAAAGRVPAPDERRRFVPLTG
jgi:2-phospho-L-lactate guanylyltransferase